MTRSCDHFLAVSREAMSIARSLGRDEDRHLKRLAELVSIMASDFATLAHHVAHVQDELRYRTVIIEDDPEETPTPPERVVKK